MAQIDLEAEVKGQIRDLQAMTYYTLVSDFQAVGGAIIREI